MKYSYLIGMGSNIEPEQHLAIAAVAIRNCYPEVCFSSVYRSAAVGMHDAADFLNACCRLQSELTAQQIGVWLKQLEDEHGRDRSHGSWKPRTLDLDLLMAGDDVLDEELFRYAHAYVPARELVALAEADVNISVLHKTGLCL
ncbi:MAG: 2-amino-4-hydroxy-6-hydroxymethyldihydropteridine diphosphokinase [Mariprofundaceae bacterium]|nr:2-amino-4-hydroxy-6-hydroxymethyldihydropteridine diphosphokinase [Mariprofundaceae bacterium]